MALHDVMWVSEEARKMSRGKWAIVVAVVVVLAVVVGIRRSEAPQPGLSQSTVEKSADTYAPQKTTPAKPLVTAAIPDRRAKLKAWVAFVRTDPGMKQVVQRVEVHPGSARGIGVTVYLKPGPGSAIGKAAAKDPAAEPVELAAKMLSRSFGSAWSCVRQALQRAMISGSSCFCAG
jgi:hypothetical protein